jgi:hypothetical protein
MMFLEMMTGKVEGNHFKIMTKTSDVLRLDSENIICFKRHNLYNYSMSKRTSMSQLWQNSNLDSLLDSSQSVFMSTS